MMLSVALAAALAASRATPTPEQVARVRTAISPIETSPQYDAIRALPYARPAFEAIAVDNTIPATIRTRALEGIASYQDTAAFRRVGTAIEDTSLPVVVRRGALVALGVSFQTKALPTVERILARSDDVQFRRVAAMTLKRIKAPESLSLARQAQLSETNPVVFADLAAAIQALQEKPVYPKVHAKGGAR